MDEVLIARMKKFVMGVVSVGGALTDITINQSGELVITFTPASGSPVTFNAGQIPAGQSIQSAAINASGHLVLTFDDGTTIDCGNVKGEDGSNGEGVPAGGSAGQTLVKNSGADFDTKWSDPPSGGDKTAEAALLANNYRMSRNVGDRQQYNLTSAQPSGAAIVAVGTYVIDGDITVGVVTAIYLSRRSTCRCWRIRGGESVTDIFTADGLNKKIILILFPIKNIPKSIFCRQCF